MQLPVATNFICSYFQYFYFISFESYSSFVSLAFLHGARVSFSSQAESVTHVIPLERLRRAYMLCQRSIYSIAFIDGLCTCGRVNVHVEEYTKQGYGNQ